MQNDDVSTDSDVSVNGEFYTPKGSTAQRSATYERHPRAFNNRRSPLVDKEAFAPMLEYIQRHAEKFGVADDGRLVAEGGKIYKRSNVQKVLE